MKLREMQLRVRELSEDERATIATWCGTQAGSVRLRDRATIIAWSAEGWWVSDIARIVRVTPQVVRKWIKRFNAEGLAGLKDQPRSGRPATDTAEQIGEVVTAALTTPETLGLPFASWTLDRLAAYLAEERDLPIKRSRIDEVLIAEGLRWRHQETWFGERIDPAFAEQRGPSSPSPPRHLQEVS
jgi:transposase